MKSQGGKERVLVKYALLKQKEERRGEIIRVLANIKHHSIIRDKTNFSGIIKEVHKDCSHFTECSLWMTQPYSYRVHISLTDQRGFTCNL